jgi:hypothetical protein
MEDDFRPVQSKWRKRSLPDEDDDPVQPDNPTGSVMKRKISGDR